jgi:hypothetical protein
MWSIIKPGEPSEEALAMNAKTELCKITAEIAEDNEALRRNLARIIRARSGITAEERAQLDQHGLRFDGDCGAVTWYPPPGEESDYAVERRHLLCAFQVLLGPIEPITAEELAEAVARGDTFGDMLAELGVFDAEGAEVHKE